MAFQVCPLCKGSGVFEFKECPVCKGKRIIDEKTGLPPKDDDNRENGVNSSEDSIERILKNTEERNKQFWYDIPQKHWFEYPQFDAYPPSPILC